MLLELSVGEDETMEGNIDVNAIREILSRNNTVEVKKNKDGNVIILEVRKKIVKTK